MARKIRKDQRVILFRRAISRMAAKKFIAGDISAEAYDQITDLCSSRKRLRNAERRCRAQAEAEGLVGEWGDGSFMEFLERLFELLMKFLPLFL